MAFYSSPLARVSSKFTSYIAAKPVMRDIRNELLNAVNENADGKGNESDVFWQDFMVEAKARGSMLLLVDMPPTVPDNLQTQLTERAVPYWTQIKPELLTDWQIGDDGRFDLCYLVFSVIVGLRVRVCPGVGVQKSGMYAVVCYVFHLFSFLAPF